MSCFGGHEEQLYLVELTIEKLKLTQEKIQDFSDCSLIVKVKFIDFPILEISKQDFYFVKPSQRDSDGTLEFAVGKCCLFTKQPRDLMRMMQSTPMKIGIFCAGDSFPIAETQLPLSGCLCDQVAMASNDPEHLPKPYILKGGFHLMDPGKNPSGIINLDLRLNCLGKSFTTHYQLRPKSFLFKSDHDKHEYCVKRVLPSDICANNTEFDITKCGDNNLLAKIEEECLETEKPEMNNGKGEKNGRKKKKGKKKKK